MTSKEHWREVLCSKKIKFCFMTSLEISWLLFNPILGEGDFQLSLNFLQIKFLRSFHPHGNVTAQLGCLPFLWRHRIYIKLISTHLKVFQLKSGNISDHLQLTLPTPHSSNEDRVSNYDLFIKPILIHRIHPELSRLHSLNLLLVMGKFNPIKFVQTLSALFYAISEAA